MTIRSISAVADRRDWCQEKMPLGLRSINTSQVLSVDRSSTPQPIVSYDSESVCLPLPMTQDQNNYVYELIRREQQACLALANRFDQTAKILCRRGSTDNDMTACAELAARVVALGNRQLVEGARENIDRLIELNRWSTVMTQSFLDDQSLKVAVKARVHSIIYTRHQTDFADNEELQRFLGDDMALLLCDSESVLYVKESLQALAQEGLFLFHIKEGLFGSVGFFEWRLGELTSSKTLRPIEEEQLGMILAIFMAHPGAGIRQLGQINMQAVKHATPLIRTSFSWMLNSLNKT